MLLSDGTVDLARSEAACAYGSLSYSAVIIDPYGLDISVPFSLCMDVGVRNSISRCLTLAAYFTFSGHLPHLLVTIFVLPAIASLVMVTQQVFQCKHFFIHFSMFFIYTISSSNKHFTGV
jgi:hypothetical protein